MFRIVFFVFLILPAARAENLEKSFSLNIDGKERTYLVYSPKELTKVKVPLMIVLHGGTGNASHSSRTMGVNEVALKNHFIVAYPNGTSLLIAHDRRVWNSGGCCGVASRKNVNDVHFIGEMIKEVQKNFDVDERRIYVTGESNGAMLAYRLLCELPDVFAAAAPFSGSLGVDQCPFGKNVALFDFHGSKDESVPYGGGVGKGISGAKFRSIPDTIKLIASKRDCAPPLVETLPNGDTIHTYSCKAGAPIQTLLIKNGKHEWSKTAAEQVWNACRNAVKSQ